MTHSTKIESAVSVRNTFLHIEEDEVIEDKRRKRRASSDPPIYGRKAAEVEPADCDAPRPCEASACETAQQQQQAEQLAHDAAGGADYLQLCTPCTSRGASPERGRLAMSQPAYKMEASSWPHGRSAGFALSLSDALDAASQAAVSPTMRRCPVPLAPPPGNFPTVISYTPVGTNKAACFASFEGAYSPVSPVAPSKCSTAAPFWDLVTPLSSTSLMSVWADPRSPVSPFCPSPLAAPAIALQSPTPWTRSDVPSSEAHGQQDACKPRETVGEVDSQSDGMPAAGFPRGDSSAKPLPQSPQQLPLEQVGCGSERTSSYVDGGETQKTPRQPWSDMEGTPRSPRADGKSGLAGLDFDLERNSGDETESTAESDTVPAPAGTLLTTTSRLVAGCQSADAVLQVVATECSRRDLPIKEIIDALQAAAQKVTGSAPAGTVRLPAFAKLISSLKGKVQQGQLGQVSENMKVLKALGKLEVQGPHAHWFIPHFEGALRSCRLSSWASQDLVFCLWALAKMVPDGASRGAGTDASRRVAHNVVVECVSRVHDLKPQCLTMSIHAIAKLRLSGEAVDKFASKCMQECAGSRDLESFAPQSLANILWAAVQLSPGARGKGSGGLTDKQVWPLWHAVHRAARPRLCAFPAQELAMVANSTSKLQQRALKCRSDPAPRGPCGEVDAFLLEIGRAAVARVGELSAQGISNIALSLAKGGTLSSDVTRNFLMTAAERAWRTLDEWEPQAISNFCCAIGRICSDNRRPSSGDGEASLDQVFGRFADSVAHETAKRVANLGLALEGRRQRPKQFGWVDVSGVLTAFGHGKFCSKQIFELALHVLGEAQRSVHELSLRILLNVCLSASRLGASPEFVEPLAYAIAHRHRNEHLTVQDKRQWDELAQFCGLAQVAMQRAR